MEKVRLVIVDDHPYIRMGYRVEIEKRKDDFLIVGEAGDAKEALIAVKKHQPDVVILDIILPDMDGISLAMEIKHINSKIKLLFVSMRRDIHLLNQALAAGGTGFILKDSDADSLMNGLESVANGGCSIDLNLSTRLARFQQIKARNNSHASDPYDLLTPREKIVYRQVADGKTSEMIATTLGIAKKTVQNHRSNILKKLQLHNAADIMKQAKEREDMQRMFDNA